MSDQTRMPDAASRCGLRAVPWLSAVLCLASAATTIAGTPPAGAPAGPAAPVSVLASEPPADVVVANRKIVTLRASVYGVGPADRAAAVAERIAVLVDRGGGVPAATMRRTDGGFVIGVNGETVFRLFDHDVDPESGLTTQQVTAQAVSNLGKALAEVAEARDARALLPAVGYSLLATLGYAALLWLLVRGYRWAARRVRAAFERETRRLAPGWGGHVFGGPRGATLVTTPLRIAAWLLALLSTYQWVGFVLRRFPYTRPWGETLQQNLTAALAGFGLKALGAIPGLLFVVLIFAIARLIVRAVRSFFEGVHDGRFDVGWVDRTTARPTGKLVTAIIWLFALVAAYPYIPGSESEAFKGVGVFVGLMLSIGSSGIVNQAVSGLMLMYTRALRVGEFVQIGETEGVVKAIGFLTTHIETVRHEEVILPNALIAASVTRNYSRLAAERGLRIATKVTIGYDTPWRQVHAMLRIAAGRTVGLAREAQVRVLQTALLDFYVEYTLLVTIKDPRQRALVLTELHANIQDVFNEHRVQIMSPNYEADPAAPKIVRSEDLYAAPATRETPELDAARTRAAVDPPP